MSSAPPLKFPQGSILSPLLYASYIDGLQAELSSAGVGIRIAGEVVPLLLYADDICLLARNPAELELALRITEDFARRWRFSVNHGKSNVVVFGSKTAKAAAEMRCWQFAGKRIRTASEYKYLGLEFVSGGHRGKWNTISLPRLH